MVLKAPVEIEMRKSKDGLGFNIKGGRDRRFIEARDPRTVHVTDMVGPMANFRDDMLDTGYSLIPIWREIPLGICSESN